MHKTSKPIPLLTGPVFGKPTLDSGLRFTGRSRVLRYDVDNFDVHDVQFDSHLVAVASQTDPLKGYRRIDTLRRHEVICPGGVIVVPSGALHDSAVSGSGAFTMVALSDATLRETSQMLDCGDHPQLVPNFPDQPDDLMAALMHEASSLVRLGDVGRSLELDTCLHRMAVRLLARYAQRAPQARAINFGLSSTQVRRIREWVLGHLSEAISIDQLAAEVCLSRHHFLRQFKRATGLTPGQFVIEQRMAEARRSLIQSAAPVSTIGVQCGFSTEAHFSYTFRRRYGQTPSQFRQNHAL